MVFEIDVGIRGRYGHDTLVDRRGFTHLQRVNREEEIEEI